MSKFVNWLKNACSKLKAANKRGLEWLGVDGILNMETSALLTIFFMIFFPVCWSMMFSAIVVLGKCLLDKSRGHKNEMHDFICALIGVLVGAILGPAHAAVTLF